MNRSIYTLSKLHDVYINNKEQQKPVTSSSIRTGTLFSAQDRKSNVPHNTTKTANTKCQYLGRDKICKKTIRSNNKSFMEKEKQVKRVSTRMTLLTTSLGNKQNCHVASASKNQQYRENTSLDERLINITNRNNYGVVINHAKKLNGILKKNPPQVKNKAKNRPTQGSKKRTYTPNILSNATGQRNTKPKAPDAISLYQYYKRAWNHWHIPGESSSYPTDWEIR